MNWRFRRPGTRRRDTAPDEQDRELIAQVLAGDAGAQDELVSQYRGLAIGLARGRFNLDPLAANEVWQEVVLRLWADDHKALRSWRGEGRFSTYLTVIVINVCIRLESAGSRRAAVTESLDAAAHVADSGLSPGARADRRERQQVLESEIKELSSRDRLLLSLRFSDGHTPTEIAGLLHRSPGAVRKALHDAKKRLRKRLLASHPEFFDSEGNATHPERSHSSGDGDEPA